VGARRATLTGSVNPEGSRVTDCELQWGSDATYEGVPIPCHGVHGAGARPLAVTGEVGGLAPDTVYHYRFVAENAIGRTYGPDRTFTTSRARGRRLFRIATLLSTARPALYARTRDVLRPASGKPARVRVHLFTLTRTALAGQPITIVDGSRTSVARTNRSGIASYRMRPGPDRVVTFRFAGARRYAPAKMELRVRYAPARSR
jgi:hypothetical protein